MNYDEEHNLIGVAGYMDIYERVARTLHADHSSTPWEDEKMSRKRRFLRQAKLVVNVTMGVLDKHECASCGEAVA